MLIILKIILVENAFKLVIKDFILSSFIHLCPTHPTPQYYFSESMY